MVRVPSGQREWARVMDGGGIEDVGFVTAALMDLALRQDSLRVDVYEVIRLLCGSFIGVFCMCW